MGEYMTLAELAQRTGLSEHTLLRYARTRGLPLYRMESNQPPYGRWTEIDAWFKKHSQPAFVSTGKTPPRAPPKSP